jgi:DNA-binding GntR family transcriptional regulator
MTELKTQEHELQKLPLGVDDIIATVEEDIVLGRLHPKERLIEEDLIERFGCKRHIVRQALFQLEGVGLIERIKNRGAFVKAYSSKEVEDLYAMREILELAGASFIPLPAPPKMIEELEDIHHHYINAVEHQELRSVFRLNIAFHQALFSLTGNALLSETINEFAQKAHGIRFIAITNTKTLMGARDDHQGMIDAIKQQDRARLSELCRSHILPSKEIYLDLIGKFK